MKTHIVVGGGILGASAVYHLAKSGEAVTLIDRRDKGQATDAGAGIICPWLSQRRNKEWYHLAKNGAKYYPDLIRQLEEIGEPNTGYARVGAMSLHTDESKLDKIEERVYKRKETAPEIGSISRLSSEETKVKFPPLADGFGAVHVSGGARVNGRLLRDALIRAAEKHGAQVIHGSASLRVVEDRVTGVDVEDSFFEADKVIVTSGAWSKELLSPFNISFQVIPQKGQIVHLKMKDVANSNWPVIMPPSDYYMLHFGKGHVVFGATREDNSGFDYRVTARGLNDVLNVALQLAPGLSDSEVVETRVGFRPFTTEFLPVIGAIPNKDGLLIADGLGASGLTTGPFLGSQLAKLAIGEELDFDISSYAVESVIKKR